MPSSSAYVPGTWMLKNNEHFSGWIQTPFSNKFSRNLASQQLYTTPQLGDPFIGASYLRLESSLAVSKQELAWLLRKLVTLWKQLREFLGQKRIVFSKLWLRDIPQDSFNRGYGVAFALRNLTRGTVLDKESQCSYRSSKETPETPKRIWIT